jgi:hypothetical protein
MLDEIGLQKALGLESCYNLFASSNHLVHTTSAIRHPVFVHGRNYTGHTPDLPSVLARYVKTVLSSGSWEASPFVGVLQHQRHDTVLKKPDLQQLFTSNGLKGLCAPGPWRRMTPGFGGGCGR